MLGKMNEAFHNHATLEAFCWSGEESWLSGVPKRMKSACILRNPFVHSIAAHEVGHGLSELCQGFTGSILRRSVIPMTLMSSHAIPKPLSQASSKLETLGLGRLGAELAILRLAVRAGLQFEVVSHHGVRAGSDGRNGVEGGNPCT